MFPPRLRPWANPRFFRLNFLKESQIPHFPTLLQDLTQDIWFGNFLTYVSKFSRIFPIPGIFQRFPWSSVREVPCPCWYFIFLEECKIPVWTSFKMFQNHRGAFGIPRSSIFQRRASFWVALVTVYHFRAGSHNCSNWPDILFSRLVVFIQN